MKTYKPKEVAEMLGVSTRTLHNWHIKGVLVAKLTLTGRKYYTEKQIKEALDNF